jgi:hypothetical protein
MTTVYQTTIYHAALYQHDLLTSVNCRQTRDLQRATLVNMQKRSVISHVIPPVKHRYNATAWSSVDINRRDSNSEISKRQILGDQYLKREVVTLIDFTRVYSYLQFRISCLKTILFTLDFNTK